MKRNFDIRPETPNDHAAVAHVTTQAFLGQPYAGGNEQEIVERLRAGGAMVVALVAVENDAVIGQISFSKATLDGVGSWVALGPVSVLPSEQGRGVGSALIEEGLARVKEFATGCILTGNPAFYGRFGFQLAPEVCPDDQPKAYFQIVSFDAEPVVGKFAFDRAFYD